MWNLAEAESSKAREGLRLDGCESQRRAVAEINQRVDERMSELEIESIGCDEYEAKTARKAVSWPPNISVYEET